MQPLKEWYRGMALGHPLHSLVVHFPMACFILSWIVHGLYGLGVEFYPPILFDALLEVGLVSSLPAILTGLIELEFLEVNDKQWNLVTWHLSLMGTAVTVFFLGWLMHHQNQITPTTLWWLNTSGVFLLALGGWFGGELVYGEGVAVQGN